MYASCTYYVDQNVIAAHATLLIVTQLRCYIQHHTIKHPAPLQHKFYAWYRLIQGG